MSILCQALSSLLLFSGLRWAGYVMQIYNDNSTKINNDNETRWCQGLDKWMGKSENFQFMLVVNWKTVTERPVEMAAKCIKIAKTHLDRLSNYVRYSSTNRKFLCNETCVYR